MAIDFPASPVTGTTYIFNGVTYKFSAQGIWEVVGTASAILSVNVQVFSIAGAFTYIPIAGMKYCVIESVGGGGGGGGCPNPGAGVITGGGGGGSGAYSRKTVNAGVIGASKTGTVGAGGTAGTAAGGNGGNGGQTTLTGICTAGGGFGGDGYSAGTYQGGAGGDPASGIGDVVAAGAPGEAAWIGSGISASVQSGNGGSSIFGGGGLFPAFSATSTVGNPGRAYGGGGSGAYGYGGSVNRAGGAGAPGVVIITEYL